MKILFCNKYNFPFSGTEVHMFDLMKLMRAHGHETALFSMADSRGQPTAYDQYLVPPVDFKSGHAGLLARAKLAAHAIYSIDARRRLRKMIDAFEPDVAHVRNIYHHLSPSILWELKGQRIPVLYHLNDFKLLCPAYNMVSHGHACELCRNGRFRHVLTEGCYEGPAGASVVLAAEAYVHKWLGTYRKCIDRFLAPSQFVKKKLMQNGFDGNAISVLPHFQQLPVLAAADAGVDAPILYFGRLSPEKGIADLLRAAKPLPQVRVQIAGDGPQRAELEKLARELKLQNVEFLGHLEGKELDRRIAASRFTVLPSRAYETLGKTILESYAWGRAVVGSDLGSRRELVRHGETGILYPPGNVEQLTSAISFLAERPQLAKEMGAAGRRVVQTKHSPASHYRELTQLYEEMMSAARKPAERRNVAEAKRRPRIAFIGGRGVVSKYSGIETYYEEVGRRLAEAGHDVTVYCRTYFTPGLRMYKGMRLVRLPTIRSKHLETVIHTFLSTVHAIFSGKDIVHYHAQGPALFSFLPRIFGKRTVVTVQGRDWQRQKWGRVAAFVLRLGELASAHFPNTTMVVSRTLHEHYRKAYGTETVFVPNGGAIREPRRAEQILQWGLEPDNYVLYMGRLSPEKNCHLLIEAFEKLSTSAKLLLAGGSGYTTRYVEELRRHQSDRIVFLDWVSGEALDDLLTHAAIFVLPSDLEGLSLALLDAMGAGVCVLTSAIPENLEVTKGCGFSFHPGDARDLERMLRLLLLDAPTRAMTGERAKERVRDGYQWDKIANDIGHVYEELMKREPVAGERTPVEVAVQSAAELKRAA